MTKPRYKLNNDGSAYRVDAWQNGISGQGMDKTQATRFAPSIMGRLDQFTLSLLYRYDWLSRKICQRPAADATRRFIEVKNVDAKTRKMVMSRLEQVGAREKIRKAISWSRLFGGAGIIRIYDDEGTSDSELLPDSGARLVDMIVQDRYSLFPVEMDDDPTSIYFEKPIIYQAKNGKRYHRSRIGIFPGADLTDDQTIQEQFWGGSHVELTYQAIKDLQSSMQDTNYLLSESGIGILKIPNLTSQFSMGGGIQQAVMNRSNAFAQGKSIYRVGVLDAQESFEFVNRSLQGIPDIIDRFMTVVAGASDLGELILFNRSPSGLNATQEEQLQVYYDLVSSIQEGEPTNIINEIMRDISLENNIPEIEWDWAPLLQMSSEKKAAIMASTATAVATVMDGAGLSPNEVKRALNSTGVWELEEDVEEEAGEEDDPLGLEALESQMNALPIGEVNPDAPVE